MAVETYLSVLQAHLDELAGRYKVPGAVCGISVGEDAIVTATGTANVGTGVDATPDTLFQIGSISKLYTTTLLAQMIDAGLIQLDEPVRGVLHEFRVADDSATLTITPRHLLSHTSGIEGDHFLDCGRNPDALWRFVSTLEEIGQLHPPDDLYSYCNAGFGVAGRLVEEVTGDHFTRALRRRLLKPVGLSRTLALAEHAIIHRVAAGHRQEPGGEPEVQPWTLSRFNTPIGGLLAPADDLLEFARLHLRKGKSADGRQILPGRAVSILQSPQVDQPDGNERGLGWVIYDWGDTVSIGHDGDTIGQRSYLRLLPGHDAAITILTNSFTGAPLARDLLRTVAGDLFDAEITPLPEVDPGLEVDTARYTDTYERLHQQISVTATGTGLRMTLIPDEFFRAAGIDEVSLELAPAGGDRFRTVDPTTGVDVLACFVDPDDDEHERPGYLHYGGRAHRRIT